MSEDPIEGDTRRARQASRTPHRTSLQSHGAVDGVDGVLVVLADPMWWQLLNLRREQGEATATTLAEGRQCPGRRWSST